MNNLLIDPNLAHAKASKVGILLVNLGTQSNAEIQLTDYNETFTRRVIQNR